MVMSPTESIRYEMTSDFAPYFVGGICVKIYCLQIDGVWCALHIVTVCNLYVVTECDFYLDPLSRSG